jgi:hypothetical protein
MNEVMRGSIKRSPYWLTFCATAGFLEVCGACIDLEYVGGTHGPFNLPTPSLCLLLRLLTLKPPQALVDEMIEQPHHKYLRLMGFLYRRLTAAGAPQQIHRAAAVCLEDYRKVRVKAADGAVAVACLDEVVARLVDEDAPPFCGMPLPALLSLVNTKLLHPAAVDWC